jgi:osmotically-inducible protein OsmY
MKWMTGSRAAAALVVTALLTSACAPLVVGGAAATALVANDRRTTGTVVEDNAIEVKVSNAIEKALSKQGHISVTSFNRRVLLTGEAPTEALKAMAEEVAKRGDNVVLVINELAVAGNASTTQRAADTLLSSRVKVAFISDEQVDASAVKVVTDRGQVYLMGLLTQREADRATDVARRVPGVQGVVRVIELISEQELLRIKPPAQAAEPTSSGG